SAQPIFLCHAWLADSCLSAARSSQDKNLPLFSSYLNTANQAQCGKAIFVSIPSNCFTVCRRTYMLIAFSSVRSCHLRVLTLHDCKGSLREYRQVNGGLITLDKAFQAVVDVL